MFDKFYFSDDLKTEYIALFLPQHYHNIKY